MIYNLITPATALPVSLVDVKEHLRITHSSHDDLITSIIWGATRQFENRSNECLSAQTWDLVLSEGEVLERIVFFKYPVSAITSVSYYDSDNALQTTSDYVLFSNGKPASIRFDCDSDEVPTTYDRDDSMTIRFVCGYTTLPEDIKQAVLAKIFRLYENPGDPVSEKVSFFDKVVRDYRSYDL